VSAIAAAAETIAAARLARRPLGLLPESIRPKDEAGAYRVQEAVHALLASSRVGRRVGYKIGCTTPVMQTYLGIPSPCSAGVFAGVIHRGSARLPFGDYLRVGIECEIAVRLGRDLAPAEAPFTAESVAGAVAAYMTAIEIVDDRYADWRKTDTPTLIADDFFAAGAVLAEPVAAEEVADVASLIGTTAINGAEAGRGRGADVMGHPLNALAWLANSLAARGTGLRRDEIVLTGSLVETKWLAKGDRAIVSVSGLGSVELTVI
jgi:2-keto-4-pentenoate hydratase